MFTFLRSWWNSLVLKMTSWCKSQIFLSVFSYTEQTVDAWGEGQSQSRGQRDSPSWGWDLLLHCSCTPGFRMGSHSRSMCPAQRNSRKALQSRVGWGLKHPWVFPCPACSSCWTPPWRTHGPHPSSDGQIEGWTHPNWTWICGCQGIPPI